MPHKPGDLHEFNNDSNDPKRAKYHGPDKAEPIEQKETPGYPPDYEHVPIPQRELLPLPDENNPAVPKNNISPYPKESPRNSSP